MQLRRGFRRGYFCVDDLRAARRGHVPDAHRKCNRHYRYYVGQDVLRRGPEVCSVGRVPAAEIETAVIDQLCGIFRLLEIIVGTLHVARAARALSTFHRS